MNVAKRFHIITIQCFRSAKVDHTIHPIPYCIYQQHTHSMYNLWKCRTEERNDKKKRYTENDNKISDGWNLCPFNLEGWPNELMSLLIKISSFYSLFSKDDNNSNMCVDGEIIFISFVWYAQRKVRSLSVIGSVGTNFVATGKETKFKKT